MADRWVVDADYPTGHLVAMTPGEEAQLERDREATGRIMAAEAEIRAAANERVADLGRAREELAAGVIFSALSARERAVIELLIGREI